MNIMTPETSKETPNVEMLAEIRREPSAFQKFWNWLKPYVIPFILGMIVGGLTVGFWKSPVIPGITQTTLEQKAASGGAVIPFSERQSLAESLDVAAERLERGVDRLLVDDYIRTAIAQQPTSRQWTNTLDKILQTAVSPDAVVYAKNLRQIAKGLKR